MKRSDSIISSLNIVVAVETSLKMRFKITDHISAKLQNSGISSKLVITVSKECLSFFNIWVK